MSTFGHHLPAAAQQRATQSFGKLIPYWKEHAEEVFPDLLAHSIGWGEPHCFRCGWLVPLRGSYSGPWGKTGPWLEFAHLQDFALGGTCEPENVVPLCVICHRVMPRRFGARDAAIEWVKRGQPNACPWWWQQATDDRWSGDPKLTFPGYGPFLGFYQHTAEQATKIMQRVSELQREDAARLLAEATA